MSDLAAFLAARLDEDEARAKAMAEPGGSHWPWLETRLLREVAAKRAILSAYESQRAARFGDPAVVGELRDVVQTLASVYSDHPDYDQEWERQAV